MEEDILYKYNYKKVDVVIFILNKINLKIEMIIKDKEKYFINRKGQFCFEDIIMLMCICLKISFIICIEKIYRMEKIDNFILLEEIIIFFVIEFNFFLIRKEIKELLY